MVLIDQVTKIFIKGLKLQSLGIELNGMPYGSSKTVFGEFFKITFIENPGMAFGLNIGPKLFLTLFTIAASFLILYYIWKHRNDGKVLRVALALILAGAVGNLIDRTFYGKIYGYAPFFEGRVVDFLQIDFWDFTIFGRTYTTWPIFNVADMSVSAGFVVILLFHNSIFKQDELQIENPDSELSGSIQINSSENSTEIQTENSNGVSFEDTKGNASSDSAGSEETQDR